MLGFKLLSFLSVYFFSSLVFKFLYFIIQEFFVIIFKVKKKRPISLRIEINSYIYLKFSTLILG